MGNRTSPALKATHRISMTSDEIDELAAHLAALKAQINLSKNLTSIYSKLVINQTKVNLGVKLADYTATGTGRSAMSKLGDIDPDTYLMQYGNPEEQAAVNEAMTQTILTGEPHSWEEFMPALGDRKYPATELPSQ